MKWILRALALCGVFGCLVAALPGLDRLHEAVFDDAGLLQADADQLRATIVSPHLEVPIQEGTNVLWCGTFQLAWNEACGLIGEDLDFEDDEPQMVGLLNKKSFKETDLDEASFVAIAEFVGKGAQEKIRDELKTKFAGQAAPRHLPPWELTPRPQDIVCYCYLFKNLEFETPFERLDEPLVFGAREVSCFGIGPEYKSKQKSIYPQVAILDYRDPDDFIIELRTKVEKDRLILAKLSPQSTLQETIAAVEDRIAGAQPLKAAAGDVLTVPKLNLDVTRRYRELEGLELLTQNPNVADDLQILSAVQNTRFQLDEKGVRLRSESHISFGCGASPSPPATHVMIFDKPFLILMKQAEAKSPYFALWVGNTELLVPRPGE